MKISMHGVHMDNKKYMTHIAETLQVMCLMLTIAGLPLASHGRVWASQMEGSMAAEVGVKQEKLSYALGMVLGKQFRDQSIAVDLDLYIQGLQDALAGGRTLLTETEARAAVNVLQSELRRKRSAPPAATARPDLKLSFKLDPRLTRSMYMGDRWVSPPTYTSTVQEGTEITVEARAQGLDARGRPVAITPAWIPADPGMVTVSPTQGNAVSITVKRPGESRLKVVSPGITKELVIKAMDRGNAMQVEISQ